jgi:hypothetical protein
MRTDIPPTDFCTGQACSVEQKAGTLLGQLKGIETPIAQ